MPELVQTINLRETLDIGVLRCEQYERVWNPTEDLVEISTEAGDLRHVVAPG
jgi:hypothetical protein